MKKILINLFLFIGVCIYAQSMEITPQGYVDAEQPDKNYVVIEFPGKSQSELYKSAKTYLNTLYNNPNWVTSAYENEQIVINAMVSNLIPVGKLYANYDFYYNYVFSFKDGKVKFEPFYKYGESFTTSGVAKLPLVGVNGGIIKYGIFNKSGKVINPNGKAALENYVNNFIENFKKGIETKSKNDW